jgi:hypothetical protein
MRLSGERKNRHESNDDSLNKHNIQFEKSDVREIANDAFRAEVHCEAIGWKARHCSWLAGHQRWEDERVRGDVGRDESCAQGARTHNCSVGNLKDKNRADWVNQKTGKVISKLDRKSRYCKHESNKIIYLNRRRVFASIFAIRFATIQSEPDISLKIIRAQS